MYISNGVYISGSLTNYYKATCPLMPKLTKQVLGRQSMQTSGSLFHSVDVCVPVANYFLSVFYTVLAHSEESFHKQLI